VMRREAVTPRVLRVCLRAALGPVRGVVTDKGRQFRGIPYASPPVGALRWKNPVPGAVCVCVRLVRRCDDARFDFCSWCGSVCMGPHHVRRNEREAGMHAAVRLTTSCMPSDHEVCLCL
jgi:hypothetical protein